MYRERSLTPTWQPVLLPSLSLPRLGPRPFDKPAILMRVMLGLFLATTIFAFFDFDCQNIDLVQASLDTVANFRTLLWAPQLSHFSILAAFHGILVTLSLAFLTTVIGSGIALIFGLMAAQNLSTPLISSTIKGAVAFVRAVPTILWVLFFAVSAGLGSVAAVVGMTFHSAGYLIKAYSEAFEEVDNGVIEALAASGASWWQIVVQAVLPSSASYLMSWTFMRFEINFAVAVAVGAAAGAGGIGFDLFLAGAQYFDLREVGFITYLVLGVAVLLETITSKVKLGLRVNT